MRRKLRTRAIRLFIATGVLALFTLAGLLVFFATSGPDFTASLRINRPNLVIVDEKTIPEDFWIPQPPKLDRDGLGNAMRGGQKVLGAELGNASVSLAVRTK